jgi:hypothetical protein
MSPIPSAVVSIALVLPCGLELSADSKSKAPDITRSVARQPASLQLPAGIVLLAPGLDFSAQVTPFTSIEINGSQALSNTAHLSEIDNMPILEPNRKIDAAMVVAGDFHADNRIFATPPLPHETVVVESAGSDAGTQTLSINMRP